MKDEFSESFRKLTPEEISILEEQGCKASDWNKILVSQEYHLENIRNAYFIGDVKISAGVEIRDVPGGISNCHIKRNAKILNVAELIFDKEPQLGCGIRISVLDGTGSRPVCIYPGISSQIATLMARQPRWLSEKLEHQLRDFLDLHQTTPSIGENAVIKNCGSIKNVHVGDNIIIEGVIKLENGSIINNSPTAKSIAYVGNGVIAENFIIEDGRVESQAMLFNCYVGQGAVIAKGFTAHDSLFFANSAFENGESGSYLAGPFSVSMHKNTLLIGLQTSFFNAGSASNQSNHMYKLGPVHWGVMERGVKTSSNSYLMLGAKIGAFSLLMGSHKTHPDSSLFPFSYLFGDERGATVVVPAVMLRSCGLLRDENKWRQRDRRIESQLILHDQITFNVLNPMTVDAMLSAINTIEELLTRPSDDDLYMRFKGMKFRRAALERAAYLYRLAIFKYLYQKLPEGVFPPANEAEAEKWVDLGGLIMTRTQLNNILEVETIEEAEKLIKEAADQYEDAEIEWIAQRFDQEWRKEQDNIKDYAEKFDSMIEEDRQEYLSMLDMEEKMLAL